MKRLAWTLLALMVGLAPCAGFAANADAVPGRYDLPRLGDPGGGAISPAELDEIGRQELVQLRRYDLILQDPLVTNYIRDVGHRIAAQSDSPGMNIHYYVIATPVMNSFAFPGRNVAIFTGLFTATDNENELAGVIAHETAHVTQHHMARQVADMQGMGWKELAGLLGGIILGAATGNPQVGMATIMGTQAAIIQHQINFTRHDEEEADRVGIGFMARAGYNPDGMAQMFQKFEIMSRGELKPPAFLIDHPMDTVRISDASERAHQMPKITHKDSRSYLLMRARARVLVADRVEDALAYFNGIDTSKLSETGKNAIAYGRALCLIRMNRAGKALAILTPLLDKHPDVVAYHLGVGNAELKNGETDKALATFEHTAKIFPDSLAVQVDQAQALLAANRAGDAKTVLQNAAMDNGNNPLVLHLLAEASSQAGNLGEARYYLSQYYELNGKLDAAITQIRLALDDAHPDSYEKARYRARLEDLQKARKMHKKDARNQMSWHFGVQRVPEPYGPGFLPPPPPREQ